MKKLKTALFFVTLFFCSFASAEKQCEIPEASYPEEAKLQGKFGVTSIRFFVNRDGTLLKTEIVKSSGHAELDESALLASKKIVCKPLIYKGESFTIAPTKNYIFSRNETDLFEINKSIYKDRMMKSLIPEINLIIKNSYDGQGYKNSIFLEKLKCDVPEPKYSHIDKAEQAKGTVIVRVKINESGAVQDAAIIRPSDNQRFNISALEAAKQINCPFKKEVGRLSLNVIHGYVFGY